LASVEQLPDASGADRVAAPIKPPLGFTGQRPPISIVPSSTARQDSPGGVNPKWSIAMYSDVVKQSCVSMA
jgi:hypothetical protein